MGWLIQPLFEAAIQVQETTELVRSQVNHNTNIYKIKE